jgi:Domain of unknown function (DUF4956)
MGRFWNSPIARLAAYYVLLGLAVLLLVTLLPGVRGLFERFQELSPVHGLVSKRGALEEAVNTPGPASLGATALGLITLLSMLGALALALPTAWVYMLTKQHRGYDQAVVQTVIVLPMIVAGTLILVQNSLALAFALGGIVAAIRFRNTLKDTRDVVYVYLVLGVGLAAGLYVPVVAAVMSLVFNTTVLVLWQLNVGNIYADQRALPIRLPFAAALVGPGGKTGEYLALGDPKLLAALSPPELAEVAAGAARLRQYIEARASAKKRERFNGLCVVHATELEAAQHKLEAVLKERTSRWKLAELKPGDGGPATLEYLVRLEEDETRPATLLAELKARGAPQVVAAEYRSLKGMRT